VGCKNYFPPHLSPPRRYQDGPHTFSLRVRGRKPLPTPQHSRLRSAAFVLKFSAVVNRHPFLTHSQRRSTHSVSHHHYAVVPMIRFISVPFFLPLNCPENSPFHEFKVSLQGSAFIRLQLIRVLSFPSTCFFSPLFF